MVDLGVGAGGEAQDWEEAISSVAAGCVVALSDGSRDESGRVAGWCDSRDGEGGGLVGSVATVWDGEIAGMRLVLEAQPVAPLLVLSDSRAALAAVKNAVGVGKARMADLRAMVDLVGTCNEVGGVLRFGWVKAHAGVWGNERADALAKAGCGGGGIPRAKESGVRALCKKLRAGEKSVSGLGAGRISGWGRRAASRYMQLRTGKDDLVVWREKLGRGLGSCRLCQGGLETGGHLVFRCPGTREGIGW